VSSTFASDPHPGRPRILFVGFGQSSHTHSWVDLLEHESFNVRLFDLPTSTLPPAGWWVPCYITAVPAQPPTRSGRRYLYPSGRLGWLARRIRGRIAGGPDRVIERWLGRVIRDWRPDIVHTLGLDPAGFLYGQVRRTLEPARRPLWVLQLRGGSDLTLSRLDPELQASLRHALAVADQILTDNLVNVRYARELGVEERRFSPLAPLPGTGGVDIDALRAAASTPAAERRAVVWPKAYESPWSKALPVVEALRRAWPAIAPCSIHALAAADETRAWIRTLPDDLQQSLVVEARVPRARSLELMSRARVMLAPSLIDGTPNTMFEAMACGALPVVSPLESIRSVAADGQHVLFARNLYPDEIADALVRAMTDDALVARCAAANLELVRRLADRATIGPRVVRFYEELAASSRPAAAGPP
jgi:glycosyltransferase involved in cell wall biosynthesis